MAFLLDTAFLVFGILGAIHSYRRRPLLAQRTRISGPFSYPRLKLLGPISCCQTLLFFFRLLAIRPPRLFPLSTEDSKSRQILNKKTFSYLSLQVDSFFPLIFYMLMHMTVFCPPTSTKCSQSHLYEICGEFWASIERKVEKEDFDYKVGSVARRDSIRSKSQRFPFLYLAPSIVFRAEPLCSRQRHLILSRWNSLLACLWLRYSYEGRSSFCTYHDGNGRLRAFIRAAFISLDGEVPDVDLLRWPG